MGCVGDEGVGFGVAPGNIAEIKADQ